MLVSHAACRAVHDHPRNLSDGQLRELAAAGGLLGVMLHPLAIDPERRTIDRACEHLERAAEVMGVGRVALGGDFVRRLTEALPPTPPTPDGLMPPGLDEGSTLEGLEGPQDYPRLAAALAARGWSERDVAAVMGGSLLAFLRRALPDR